METSTGFATTKIQPPRARSARIARPALDAALSDALRKCRLVLLVAPAGFGKTSVLAAQIGRLEPGSALAWLSLDEDDDAARVFTGLAAALEPCDLPWRCAPPALAAQLGEPGAGTRTAVAELVNALAAADVSHGVIVLDDLHRVQSPEVTALLDVLIERLPPHWTLVISTRFAPRLSLARWRAAGELAEFAQNELRFSVDEARALVHAERVDELDVRLPELVERTQGWPAGLRLCLAALRGRPSVAALPADARHAAMDRSLFDYLASEVLDEMPAPLHDFLVRSSVLPVLTAEAAAAVTGDARAAQHLDEVERRGLFASALDAAERTLVLHDLFRDALEDRLRRRFPDELPALLRRAAAIEPDAQRRLALQLRAADWAAAEATLAQACDDLLLEGLAVEVRRLVAQFTPGWRERSPRLLRIDAIAACMRWKWNEMATLLEASVAAARRAGDEGELRRSQGLLLAAWNATGQQARSDELLGELEGRELPPEVQMLVLDAQCTRLYQRGDHAVLKACFEQVTQRLEASGSLMSWWEVSPPTPWAGLPGMGPIIERFCSEALRRCGERELPMRATLHALQAATHLWAGRIDTALALAGEAESDARWLARAAEIEVSLHNLRVIFDALRGDADSVLRRLDLLFTHEDAHAAPGRLQFWRSHVAQLAVRVLDLLGSDAATLRRWQAWHPAPPPHAGRDPLAARIAAAESRWTDAAEAFTALLPQAAKLDAMGQGIELQLRAAHALLQCGRLDEAGAPLAQALQAVLDAQARGHALMAGPRVLGALAARDWGTALALPLRDTLHALAAQSMLLRGAAPASPQAPSAPRLESTTLLSSREREVLERIAAGDSNKLIARVLDISPHTVKRHVANILDKLALESRGQAAAWLRANP